MDALKSCKVIKSPLELYMSGSTIKITTKRLKRAHFLFSSQMKLGAIKIFKPNVDVFRVSKNGSPKKKKKVSKNLLGFKALFVGFQTSRHFNITEVVLPNKHFNCHFLYRV